GAAIGTQQRHALLRPGIEQRAAVRIVRMTGEPAGADLDIGTTAQFATAVIEPDTGSRLTVDRQPTILAQAMHWPGTLMQNAALAVGDHPMFEAADVGGKHCRLRRTEPHYQEPCEAQGTGGGQQVPGLHEGFRLWQRLARLDRVHSLFSICMRAARAAKQSPP